MLALFRRKGNRHEELVDLMKLAINGSMTPDKFEEVKRQHRYTQNELAAAYKEITSPPKVPQAGMVPQPFTQETSPRTDDHLSDMHHMGETIAQVLCELQAECVYLPDASFKSLRVYCLRFQPKGTYRIDRVIASNFADNLKVFAGLDSTPLIVPVKGALEVQVPLRPSQVTYPNHMMYLHPNEFPFYPARLTSLEEGLDEGLTWSPGVNLEGKPLFIQGSGFSACGVKGSGKSHAGLNCLIQIMRWYAPWEIQFVLIDPGGRTYRSLSGSPWLWRSENFPDGIICSDLTQYEKIHAELMAERVRRSRLFDRHNITSLSQWRRSCSHIERLPWVFVFYEEFRSISDERMGGLGFKVANAKPFALADMCRKEGFGQFVTTSRLDGKIIEVAFRNLLTGKIVLRMGDEASSNLAMGKDWATRLSPKGDSYVSFDGSWERVQVYDLGKDYEWPEVVKTTINWGRQAYPDYCPEFLGVPSQTQTVDDLLSTDVWGEEPEGSLQETPQSVG